ncbi:MAG: nucleotidyl transferase AbiEii/AbiGii toxin family protein [Alphaproteobacteria bacterium]|nr:nucleotidyl transferase AbiEii/AbiGii toxin family protein [Alphaproteobacteria bacterium]
MYLTGGAALGHFYLRHRGSHHLDWFTPDREEIPPLAARLVAFCEARSHEPVPQTVPLADKPVIEGVRVDSLDDIIANKLSAVLGRGETKDLVDLLFLARAGHDPLAYLEAARDRDGGMDPATLAWVLESVPTDPSELLLEAPLTQAEVSGFRDGLVRRLQGVAFPEPRS